VAVYTETIKLEDGVTAPAKKATGALENLTESMLKNQMAEKLASDKGAMKAAATAKSAATKKMIADNTKLTNTMATVRDAVSSSVGAMKGAFASMAEGDVKSAISGVTDAAAGMAKLLDLVVPGLGQAASIVIQIAGGLVGITAGLIKSGVEFAIASTQSKIAMISMFDALGEGKITGEQVDDMLDGLSDKLGITKDAMQPITQKFLQMGITGQDALEKMTTAALSAKALVGSAGDGAAAFESLSKKIQLASSTGQGLKIPLKGLGALAEMGVTVDDVAAKMGVSAKVLGQQLKAGTADASKFGNALQDALIDKGAGPLEAMSLGAENLKAVLKQSIGDMFEDMKVPVTEFMKGVKDLFSVFGKGAESGKAMKSGIGTFFTFILETLTKLLPVAKHFFLDMIILSLKAYIYVKNLAKQFDVFAKVKESLGPLVQAALPQLWTVLKAIGAVLAVVAVVVLALWAAMVLVSVTVWSLVGAFISLMVDGIQAQITAWGSLGSTISEFVSGALATLGGWVDGAMQAATDFVAGLVAGITAGATQVVDAVKGLADAAAGAFESALDINSPSRVMMGLGVHTGQGVAEGIESTEGDVHGASSGLASAAVKGASPGGAGASGSAGSGGSPVTVTVFVDGAGKSALEITQEMATLVFEQVALQAGV
jgi:hypothetical protein